MLEAAEKRLCDALLEIDTRILCNHFLPDILRKVLISNAQDIKPYVVVERLNLNGLIGCDTRRCMQRDRIPSRLNPNARHLVMLQKLANGVRSINLKPVCLAAELFQKSKIVEGSTDEKQFRVEAFPRLTALLISLEEDTMAVIEGRGVLNSRRRPVASRVSLLSVTPA